MTRPSVRVKICGITSPRDASTATQAGAHAVGFVFAKSPRQISFEQARSMIETLSPFVEPVGLFVNESIEVMVGAARHVGFRRIQLSGDETPETVSALATALRDAGLHIGIIKGIRVKDERDIMDAERYRDAVDAYLFDAYVPGRYGGTGHSFNWELLTSSAVGRLTKPWIIAGGLTPDNVQSAITITQPYGVDVSSGVERAPGEKDPDKIFHFMNEARH